MVALGLCTIRYPPPRFPSGVIACSLTSANLRPSNHLTSRTHLASSNSAPHNHLSLQPLGSSLPSSRIPFRSSSLCGKSAANCSRTLSVSETVTSAKMVSGTPLKWPEIQQRTYPTTINAPKSIKKKSIRGPCNKLVPQKKHGRGGGVGRSRWIIFSSKTSIWCDFPRS